MEQCETKPYGGYPQSWDVKTLKLIDNGENTWYTGEKTKKYLLMVCMKAIPYLKLPQRRISISGLSDTSLKTRNGGLQILEKTLQKVISRMNTLHYPNIVVGSFISRGFVTIVPILVV